MALLGQRHRVELDTDGVFLAAVDLHLGHAADHGDSLRHQGFAVLVKSYSGSVGLVSAIKRIGWSAG